MTLLLTALVALAADLTAGGGPAWPQWGGPNRNFVVPAEPLAESWPAGGPAKLWDRPLGDGFSAIVGDGRALFTLYRAGSQDVVIALDAQTGATRWEYRYDAPFTDHCSFNEAGPGPRAAPLIAGDVLVTASTSGMMHAFDRDTGRVLWRRDLAQDAAVRPCGYSNSPIAYKDTVIALVGGDDKGVMAFARRTGEVVWHSQNFKNSYASPTMIELCGQPQLVVFTYGEVAGLNPDTGALEWMHPHVSEMGINVSMPVWGDDGLLFVSSAYNGGSRVLRVRRDGGKTQVDEVWANQRVRIHFGNAVRIGGVVYASNGDTPTAPFAAIDVNTGEFRWRTRGIARASLLASGDRLVILDEDGQLTLAVPEDAGLRVLARAPIMKSTSWTVPTLIGTTLYLRDRQRIVALDLGRPKG